MGWLPEEERGVSRPGTAPLADKFTVPEEAEAKEERERERELCDEKTTSKKNRKCRMNHSNMITGSSESADRATGVRWDETFYCQSSEGARAW